MFKDSILINFTKSQYKDGVEMVSLEKGVICRKLEAVQYHLSSYAQSSTMNLAITNFPAVSHGSAEMEREMKTKLR